MDGFLTLAFRLSTAFFIGCWVVIVISFIIYPKYGFYPADSSSDKSDIFFYSLLIFFSLLNAIKVSMADYNAQKLIIIISFFMFSFLTAFLFKISTLPTGIDIVLTHWRGHKYGVALKVGEKEIYYSRNKKCNSMILNESSEYYGYNSLFFVFRMMIFGEFLLVMR